jgi:hypothetical protein
MKDVGSMASPPSKQRRWVWLWVQYEWPGLRSSVPLLQGAPLRECGCEWTLLEARTRACAVFWRAGD